MFIEPTITWVPSGFSEYIWLDSKIVLKRKRQERPNLWHSRGDDAGNKPVDAGKQP